MKYLLLAVMSLLSFNVFASETVEQEETIMIIEAPQTADEQKSEDFPTCDNEKLIDIVREHVKSHLDKETSGSIMDIRKRRLVLKNINSYTEVPVSTFDSKENFLVANEIVMNKINRDIKESDMRLCVGEGKKPIYLLIYPEDFRYVVQIINFVPPVDGKNNFSVWYVPDVKQYESLNEAN
ncbi:MAG: hypothetical protein IJZ59_03130 [Alphaproteobacteria bacterium]|nr:hypothetical protein [Alphaproteobacteria bacterium]